MSPEFFQPACITSAKLLFGASIEVKAPLDLQLSRVCCYNQDWLQGILLIISWWYNFLHLQYTNVHSQYSLPIGKACHIPRETFWNVIQQPLGYLLLLDLLYRHVGRLRTLGDLTCTKWGHQIRNVDDVTFYPTYVRRPQTNWGEPRNPYHTCNHEDYRWRWWR